MKASLSHLLLLTALLAWATACQEDKKQEPEPGPAPLAQGIFASDGMGTPRQDISDEQAQTFARGEQVALRRFTPEDGLGPRFNVTFCTSCHEKPTFGGSAPRYRDFYLFGTALDDGAFLPSPLGGVSHSYGLGEAPIRPAMPAGVNVIARRNPIPFFGTGPIAELYEASILAHVDEQDRDGDGISGRANYDQGFVGRFGRKAQTVSIEGFIRGPLNNHLGITSDPLSNDQKNALPVPSGVTDDELERRQNGLSVVRQPQAAAPATPLMDEDAVPDPELASQDLFDLVSWAMLLGAPKPDPLTEETQRGLELFREANCSGCHVESLEGPDGRVPLYSDLLLHDMGPEMEDGMVTGLATGAEFRTQPLWGVAATGPWLHDGRADTLEDAILAHGGEAQRSKEAYQAMARQDRDLVLAFLRSLGGADQLSEGLQPPNAKIPEPGEPGGPLADLDDEQMAAWMEGRRLFDRDILQAEGLGPFFNGDSCRACHFDPVMGGAGPLGVNATRHGTWSDDGFQGPDYGTLIHKLSRPGMPRQEPLSSHNAFEPRQTPALMGLGLIDAIPEEAIVAHADPDDVDGDGVRGVVAYLPDGRLGRFGWKGGVPSVHEFVRDALSNEVGLTLPEEEDANFGFSSDDDAVPDPEVSLDTMDALTAFLSWTAPLEPTAQQPRGQELFSLVGCDACHTPSFETPMGTAWLYSDLLLHDITPEGQRGFPEGVASETQFRTPPLWGMGRTAPYMHNGAATTARDAIEAHHGESRASREAFEQLSQEDQQALLDFLGSL